MLTRKDYSNIATIAVETLSKLTEQLAVGNPRFEPMTFLHVIMSKVMLLERSFETKADIANMLSRMEK